MSSHDYLATIIKAVEEIKKNPSPENCPPCYNVLDYLYVGFGTPDNPVPKSAGYKSIDVLLGISQDEDRLSTEIILALLEEGGYVEKDELSKYRAEYHLTDKGTEFMQDSKDASDSS